MHRYTAHRTRPVAALLLFAAGVAARPATRSLSPPFSGGIQSQASEPSSAASPPPALAEAAPRHYPGLQNVVAYHEGLFSGAAPRGDAAFDLLQSWGVRTIISVDGAAPDVARAAPRELQYVHLPIGYNGFDERRRLQLARAVRDAMRRGPVYLHCHHGEHRSAGAAAAVAVSLGWSTPDAAAARMRVSGAAEIYRGLYACARNARPLAPAALDAVAADFPAVARPAGIVRAMIEIDEAHDRLILIAAAGWTTPADHPDLVPAAEAGRLTDLFRLLADHGARQSSAVGPSHRAASSDRAGRSVHSEPRPEFIEMLRRSESLAGEIERRLANDRSQPAGALPASDAAAMSDALRHLGESCRDCHARWRD